MRPFVSACTFLLLSSVLFLAGCASSLPSSSLPATQAATFSGHVHGGQQPVSGSVIQLYTVGTAGDGSASTPLLTGTVRTDANGNFNITGLYSCSAATQVYLLATGGNPGLSALNPNLALMTALGPCSALTSQTFISVNELTTVAAVYALSPYMASPTRVGSAGSDAAALAAGFTLAGQFVSPSTGLIQGSSLSVQQIAELNTLADIEAVCINSPGGIAGDSSICGHLFALSPNSSGTAPADTVTALLNIATNPIANVSALYTLIPAISPYQPTLLLAPPDLALPQTASANAASGLQISPSSLSFPSASIGVTTPSQTVMIANPSGVSVALNGLTLTGLNPSDFAQTNTCGSTLAPFASCTVAITFTPQGNATRSASLSVASATPDSPQVIALTGNSSGIAINGPHAVTDNAIVRIYPGASYDVQLSNTGITPLVISSIALGNTGFNTQTNNCPASLDSGASCTISIHSIAAGADQLSIQTNDPDFPSNILIFQPTNAPTAVFTPSDVFFADTAVSSTSRFTYTYDPSATVTPAISGPQASEFTATTPNCSIDAEAFEPRGCTFAVTFKPTSSGLRSAKLALDSSGNYIPLAGMGMSSPANSQISLGYGYYPYYPIPQVLTLNNQTSAAVPVSDITIQTPTGTPEFTETNNCGNILAARSSCTITISITRRTEGGTQALLTVMAGIDAYTMVLDDSVFAVIDFGDTAYSSTTTPGSQASSYPILASLGSSGYFPYSYVGVNGGGIAEAPWQSFTVSSCSSQSGWCMGEINFNPTAPGIQTGNAEVNENVNGPRVLQYIVLGNGVATEPAAKLILKQTGFTSIFDGYLRNQGTLTVINIGRHTATLTGPTLTGASPEKFTLGQPSCFQSTSTNSVYPSIAPGAECNIPITFSSSQTGFTSATATFTDTTSGLTFSTPLYLDTLIGPNVAPSSLTFAPTTVHNISAAQSVTVTRDITHPITATVSGGLVAAKSTCASGETPCILTFLFAPTTSPESSSLTITDATLGSSTSVPVSATARASFADSSFLLTPASLVFAAQAVGTTSAPGSVTITSTGPDPMDLYLPTIQGPNASEFKMGNNCRLPLNVNDTCIFNVTFSPASAGEKSAYLVINSQTNNANLISIPLSGTAQ